jgi:hypothetical protein
MKCARRMLVYISLLVVHVVHVVNRKKKKKRKKRKKDLQVPGTCIKKKKEKGFVSCSLLCVCSSKAPPL